MGNTVMADSAESDSNLEIYGCHLLAKGCPCVGNLQQSHALGPCSRLNFCFHGRVPHLSFEAP